MRAESQEDVSIGPCGAAEGGLGLEWDGGMWWETHELWHEPDLLSELVSAGSAMTEGKR